MTLQVVVEKNLIVSAFLWGGPPGNLISTLLARRNPMLTPLKRHRMKLSQNSRL